MLFEDEDLVKLIDSSSGELLELIIPVDTLGQLIDVVLHLDAYLNQGIALMGPWIYVLLFLIIFCETGLVITPFLPGDSLLFALGALTSTKQASLSLGVLFISLSLAAITGDAVNYSLGRRLGPKVFKNENKRWFRRDQLLKTEAFYEKYGGKTIILARFLPIIRTFAPFVAGIGRMSYGRFAVFNVTGGIVWIVLFLLAGHYFGNLPLIQNNFHSVIVAIIFISLLPAFFEFLRSYRLNKAK